jgi:sec-independent protein translocase protein TatA
MHAPGVWGIVVVAVVVILLFGRGKISGLMGEVASGIKAFRGGLKDGGGGDDEAPAASANVGPDGSRVP